MTREQKPHVVPPTHLEWVTTHLCWKVTPQIRAVGQRDGNVSEWMPVDFVLWDQTPPEGIEYQRRIYYEPRFLLRLFGKLPWWEVRDV